MMTATRPTPFVRRLAEQTVWVCCPPKLNLSLAVGCPRPDGLHPIRSVMVGLGPAFADELTLTRLPVGSTSTTIRFADDAPRPQIVDWPAEKDLAVRAHRLVEGKVGRVLPVEAELIKRIPAGSGLGGGSADAAGMLVGLRELFDLDLSDARLMQIGSELGADVSFAVHAALGRGPAWVSGIGDELEALALVGQPGFVLVLAEGACPTAGVYRALDESGVGRNANQFAVLHPPRNTNYYDLPLYNDLAASAAAVCPELKRIAQTMKQLGETAHVTGSGSACFVLCPDLQQARDLQSQVRELGLIAVATAPATATTQR